MLSLPIKEEYEMLGDCYELIYEYKTVIVMRQYLKTIN